MLREAFLVERHLEVVVLLAQEALQVSIDSFGVLHRLKCMPYTTINSKQGEVQYDFEVS